MKEARERNTAETVPSPALRPEPITVRMRAVRPAVLIAGRVDRALHDALVSAGMNVSMTETLEGASLEQDPPQIVVAIVTSPTQLPHLGRLCEVEPSAPRLLVLSDCLGSGAHEMLAKVTKGRYRNLPLRANPDEVATAAREV
jgi:hypothetical protein